jgi:hypothetical protein
MIDMVFMIIKYEYLSLEEVECIILPSSRLFYNKIFNLIERLCVLHVYYYMRGV